MDVGAIRAAAAASATTYGSFADATRSVLDLLERVMPDTRSTSHTSTAPTRCTGSSTSAAAAALGLHSNLATPLADSFDLAMAEERAPRLCNDLDADPVYAGLGDAAPRRRRLVPGRAARAVRRLARRRARRAVRPGGRFRADDEQLFTMLTRVLAYELERESNERDLMRLNDSLRDHARGMGAIGRVVGVLGGGDDARRAVCRAACEIAGAPVAFLLEPSGREFVSTAMSGIEMAPVTIQPRAETTGRAFTARESYFVADARAHPALAQPLVDATGARSALFEPVLRDGQVAGVLIVIWQLPVDSVPEGASGMLRLLAAQAAVAIEHAGLRSRMESLALTDELTGVATRRVLEEELPRELARARRHEYPVSLALLDLDELGAFNLLRGEREGDRLIKEAASLWRDELREVDLLARLGGGTFALVLPNCGLGEAIEVLDRVRAATPRGQTGSAGVARWDTEEPGELLQGRCESSAGVGQAGRAQRDDRSRLGLDFERAPRPTRRGHDHSTAQDRLGLRRAQHRGRRPARHRPDRQARDRHRRLLGPRPGDHARARRRGRAAWSSPRAGRAARRGGARRASTAWRSTSSTSATSTACTRSPSASSPPAARVDFLINNAAIMACPETRVGPGWEAQFATNHLGHFALTNRLWPALAADGGARVVAVSSRGHRRSAIRWDDLHVRARLRQVAGVRPGEDRQRPVRRPARRARRRTPACARSRCTRAAS